LMLMVMYLCISLSVSLFTTVSNRRIRRTEAP